MSDIISRHALERTSPKGGKFIGTCMKCGTPGLTFANMNDPCENVASMSDDEAIIKAIEGPERTRPMTDDLTQLRAELRRCVEEKRPGVTLHADAIPALLDALDALQAERDELDFLLHEGGTMEEQLSKAEAERDEARALLNPSKGSAAKGDERE